MRVLDRSQAIAARHALGMSNSQGQGSHSPDLEKCGRAVVAIQPAAAEGTVLFGPVLSVLLKMRPAWWLVPKYRYFGDTWSRDEWAAVGLPLLTDHVVELSMADLPTIARILASHYQQGCSWYLVSTDGEVSFSEDYPELRVVARHREEAERLSVNLQRANVANEINAPGADA